MMHICMYVCMQVMLVGSECARGWGQVRVDGGIERYIHTCIHTNIHTYTHTCTHKCMHIHTYMHTCMHTHIQTCMHACIHTYIHTTHRYMHAYMHTHMHAYNTPVHAHIHACTHACMHTHKVLPPVDFGMGKVPNGGAEGVGSWRLTHGPQLKASAADPGRCGQRVIVACVHRMTRHSN